FRYWPRRRTRQSLKLAGSRLAGSDARNAMDRLREKGAGSMPPRREPPRSITRIDGIAWIFLVAGLVVALCVCSHETDPRLSSANLLGKPGAWLAGELFATFGVGVHVL